MIVISDDGKLNISVWANPTFKMGYNSILLKLSKVKSIHYDIGLVEVSREDEYKQIELDNNSKIDPITKLIVQPDETGTYPEGSVGIFDFITSLTLGDIGQPTDNALRQIGSLIESVLVLNNMI